MRVNSFVLGMLLSPIVVVGYLTLGSLGTQQSLPGAPLTLSDIRYVPTDPHKAVSTISFRHISQKGADAEELNLKQKFGKPILVHFWAPWCGACLAEMPSLEDFARDHHKMVEILCVANDSTAGKLSLNYYQSGGFQQLSLYVDKQSMHDEGLLAKSMGVHSYPTTILISAEGKEIGRVTGPVNWSGEPGRMLLALLKVQKSV